MVQKVLRLFLLGQGRSSMFEQEGYVWTTWFHFLVGNFYYVVARRFMLMCSIFFFRA